MPAPPAWKPVVTLVPFSGVQFLDFAFSIDDTPRLQRSFLERSDPARRREDGSQIVKLEPLTGDPERDAPILDPPRDGDDLYEVSKIRALEPFLGKWTPVPVLRVRPGRGEMGEELLDTGPTTWARLRVSACDETIAGGRITHRVVLAFDTELAERVPQRPYLAPSFQDATDGQEFRFAATPEEVAWFLAWPEPETMGGQDVQSWVDDWLRELFKEFKLAQRGGRPLREEDLPHRFEHWARYLTLLELLAQAIHPPRVKLLDTVSPQRRYEPVKVDLVLDLGNSRSCGILIETYPDKPVDLNDSYRLALRDLSRPERSYDEPFASQVEFAQADFGEEHLARRSGRARALFWPSLVRVGPEAVRMASEAEGTEVDQRHVEPQALPVVDQAGRAGVALPEGRLFRRRRRSADSTRGAPLSHRDRRRDPPSRGRGARRPAAVAARQQAAGDPLQVLAQLALGLPAGRGDVAGTGADQRSGRARQPAFDERAAAPAADHRHAAAGHTLGRAADHALARRRCGQAPVGPDGLDPGNHTRRRRAAQRRDPLGRGLLRPSGLALQRDHAEVRGPDPRLLPAARAASALSSTSRAQAREDRQSRPCGSPASTSAAAPPT